MDFSWLDGLEDWMETSKFARSIPPHGIHCSTVVRWIRDGVVVLATGERVFLDAMQVGRGYRISRVAAKRFFEAQNPGRIAAPNANKATEAGRALEALGC